LGCKHGRLRRSRNDSPQVQAFSFDAEDAEIRGAAEDNMNCSLRLCGPLRLGVKNAR